ncbi:MAG: hypothetical protein ACREKL_02455 [Chthoniobacterales bacterium]
MNLRAFLLCAAFACAALGCANVEQPPPPSPAASHADPPVDQGAPVTGGELFNGNY